MSKKVTIDVKTLVLCAIILVGLILTIIGLFGDFLKGGLLGELNLSEISDLNDLAKKGDSTYEGYTATAIFAWATFVLAILITVCFTVVKILGVKGLDMAVALIGCVTVVAAILVLVFALVMANKHDASIASGPILMLIGGLLSGGAAAASGKI